MPKKLTDILDFANAGIDIIQAVKNLDVGDSITELTEKINALDSSVTIAQSKIKAIEFESVLDATHDTYAEEFAYDDDGLITQKNYYTDGTFQTKLWQVDFSFDDDGLLQQKDIMLIATEETLRIEYVYNSKKLIRKTRSKL